MPRASPPGRWLIAVAALPILAAGLAVARISPPAPETVRSDPQVLSLIASHRESEAASLARDRLARARLSHGPSSREAADAMDAFVQAVTAGGIRTELPQALSLARESVGIREAACGSACPDLAESLATFEALLWRFEDYRAALPLAERALQVRERVSGPRSQDAARGLYLLAEVHRALGNYAAAESLHLKAVSIWEKAAGDHTLDIANSLHYLGLLRWSMGDFAAARDRIQRALAMRQGATGRESERVAADLNTLGNLAVAMGDRKGAMSLFDRGQLLWERSLGEDHPHVARSLSNKGRLLAASGDYAAARADFRRALEIRLEAFGPDHHLVARSLADLGDLALRAGDFPEAKRCFKRAEEIQRKDSRTGGGDLASTLIGEGELSLASGDGEGAMSFALEAEANARAEFLATSRGLGEEDALRYETIRSTGLDVALTALEAESSGASPRCTEAASRVWDEVIRSRAMVLDEMASRLRAAPAATAGGTGLAEVLRRIPAGAALAGFVKYRRPGAARGVAESSYLALVLVPRGAPGASGASSAEAIPLGRAEEIEAAIRDWRREAGADPRLFPGRTGDERYLDAGRRLRRLIWDPLAPALKGSRLVFVVPDGAVSLVSFAALPDDGGRYLIETGLSVHYLSAERDIAAPHRPSAPGAGVLALGDADFDASPARVRDADAAFRDFAPSCRPFRTMRFEPLPGSRREVEDLAALWRGAGGVLELTGDRASEGEFKRRAPGRKILHLATHGFFLQDRCPSSLGGESTPAGGVRVGDSPLRLSGLALAGANRREEATAAEEDGILTAEEIGAMDLTGTEWAVLSGCETGLGQVLDGEGVVGLRRAFQVAGAGTLIMTLWPVDDGAARIWTRRLYEGRLAGLSTVEAVDRASLGMIGSQRESGGSTHPYFWGAFVAAGDWR